MQWLRQSETTHGDLVIDHYNRVWLLADLFGRSIVAGYSRLACVVLHRTTPTQLPDDHDYPTFLEEHHALD